MIICNCVTVAKIKTKWGSIRSSFSRELRIERECSNSGSGKRKSTVYLYAKKLGFLRPFMRLKSMYDNFASTDAAGALVSKILLQLK